MNTNLVFVLAVGGLVGLGAFILVRALAPIQTDLSDGLARLDSGTTLANHSSGLFASADEIGPLTRLLAKVSGGLGRLRITTPDADLQIIGWTREQFIGVRVLFPLCALAIGPVFSVLVWLAGFSLPWVISAVQSLGLAAVIWVVIGRWVATRADEARREMRYALVSYINVVALHRASGSGIVEALDGAANLADSWAYRKIAQQLDHSERAGQQPWEGLADLARRLDIKELADVGSIAGVSGREGASVFDTLLARARSLRGQLLAEEKTEASDASTRMAYPQTILVGVVMVFLLYPALIRLLGG